MQQFELESFFKDSNAILNGHFRLSSGLHSNLYFQSALILQYPNKAIQLATELTNKLYKYGINKTKVDVVISPAMGGVIIGHEVAKIFGVRAIFTERVNGIMTLRRGFSLKKNEKLLIIEDVITTGISTKEVIEVVKKFDVKITAIASLINRSPKDVNFKIPKFSLLYFNVKNYDEKTCPLCKLNVKIFKPGSR
ncbi:MAG: orotate phosphoribosyltransferase [Endomicrobium sp.]|jgi:orotate phosphoribosyltransferase|nr:orotate phosphoribosyltransferase [Endomicrobium sp.]